jgi:hypothetical protein
MDLSRDPGGAGAASGFALHGGTVPTRARGQDLLESCVAEQGHGETSYRTPLSGSEPLLLSGALSRTHLHSGALTRKKISIAPGTIRVRDNREGSQGPRNTPMLASSEAPTATPRCAGAHTGRWDKFAAPW